MPMAFFFALDPLSVQRIRSPFLSMTLAIFISSHPLRTSQFRAADRGFRCFSSSEGVIVFRNPPDHPIPVQSSKGLFDHPGLRGMERDDAYPSSPFQECPSRLQNPSQIFQLLIHTDAKGLKRSSGWINLPRMKPPWNGPMDDLS